MFLATPGFLTTQSSGFDPDALAYFTAVENAGGTLTETVKTAWNEFVLREKGASRYSKTLRLYPYLGGRINSAIIDAISLVSATNFNFINGNVDATCGLQGNYGSKYLDILFNPATDLAGNNFMFYVFNLNTVSAPSNYIQGGYIGSNFFLLYNSFGTSGISAKFNTSANITSSPRIASGSSIHAIRTGNSDLRLFRDGVQVGIDTTATTSTTLPNLNIFTHAISNTGNPAFYVPDKLGCNMIAENFSIVDSQGFDASYKTFLTEIGAI